MVEEYNSVSIILYYKTNKTTISWILSKLHFVFIYTNLKPLQHLQEMYKRSTNYLSSLSHYSVKHTFHTLPTY